MSREMTANSRELATGNRELAGWKAPEGQRTANWEKFATCFEARDTYESP